MTDAQRGRLYMYAIMAVAIGLPTLRALVLIVFLESGFLARLLAPPLVFGIVCLMVATGQSWAKWTLVVLQTAAAIFFLTLWVIEIGSSIFALISLAVGLLYSACVFLLFTKPFETYLRYRRDNIILTAELD